jgi:hypothetical protein
MGEGNEGSTVDSVRSETADQFWLEFKSEAPALAARLRRGELRAAFDRVEQLLEQHGFNFSFDITESEANEPVLIVTPERDQNEARRVDAFMAGRPEIKGWRFYGRRQRKPLEDAFVFVRHVHGIDVGDATFDLRNGLNGAEVTMHSAAFRDLSPEEARAATETFLDHAIGEALAMAHVKKVDTYAESGGMLSAAELVTRLIGN